MKKLRKQILTVIMLVTLVFTSACNNAGNTSTNESGTTGDSGGSTAKGRYIEEEYTSPEGVTTILAVKKQQDSSIRMLRYNGVFNSTDGGKTWELDENIDLSLYNDDTHYITIGELDQDGNVFLYYSDVTEETGAFQAIMIDKTGASHTLEIELPEYEGGDRQIFSYDAPEGALEETYADDSELTESVEIETTQIETEQVENVQEEIVQEELSGASEESEMYQLSSSSGNMLFFIEFALNGDLVALDSIGNILIIDAANGEIKEQIDASDDTYRESIHCIGDRILVQTTEGIELYDMSGTLLDSNSIINELLSSQASPDVQTIIFGGGGSESLIIPQEDGEGFYYCNRDGLYHYAFDASTSELLINGSLNTIGDQTYSFVEMVAKDDNSFLIIYMDANYEYKVNNYTFSEEAEVTPQMEIKIYSLYDNQTLRQGISTFNRNNPDIYAQLEVGIEDGNSMTESDAIKTLNTNIMAGNGPDILLMDSMSVQSYIDKGMLADISETVKEVSETDGLFENIANTYESDGEIFAVPTRFLVPVLTGDSENIDSITDLNTLAEQVTELKSQNPDMKSILGMYDETLLESLFDISASAWLQEDGTIDEAKLKEFLETVKSIQDTEGKTQEEMDEFNENVMVPVNIVMKMQKMSLTQIGSIESLSSLIAINDKMGTSHKLADGQSQNTFIPFSIIGVSAKSENIEAATSFVKEFLSSEMQSVTLEDGFPVNRAAFDEICINKLGEDSSEGDNTTIISMLIENDDGTSTFLTLVWPSEEELTELKTLVESLTSSSVLDSVIKNTVVEEGANYLSGATSLDDAVANIMQQINLYLAE